MCHCHGNVFCIQILESICQWQGNIFCIQVQKYLSACKVAHKGYKGWVKVWKPDSVAARCISVSQVQPSSKQQIQMSRAHKYRCPGHTNTETGWTGTTNTLCSLTPNILVHGRQPLNLYDKESSIFYSPFQAKFSPCMAIIIAITIA